MSRHNPNPSLDSEQSLSQFLKIRMGVCGLSLIVPVDPSGGPSKSLLQKEDSQAFTGTPLPGKE